MKKGVKILVALLVVIFLTEIGYIVGINIKANGIKDVVVRFTTFIFSSILGILIIVTIHELSHLLCSVLFKFDIHGIQVFNFKVYNLNGWKVGFTKDWMLGACTVIPKQENTYLQWLIMIIAGPASGVLCTILMYFSFIKGKSVSSAMTIIFTVFLTFTLITLIPIKGTNGNADAKNVEIFVAHRDDFIVQYKLLVTYGYDIQGVRPSLMPEGVLETDISLDKIRDKQLAREYVGRCILLLLDSDDNVLRKKYLELIKHNENIMLEVDKSEMNAIYLLYLLQNAEDSNIRSFYEVCKKTLARSQGEDDKVAELLYRMRFHSDSEKLTAEIKNLKELCKKSSDGRCLLYLDLLS